MNKEVVIIKTLAFYDNDEMKNAEKDLREDYGNDLSEENLFQVLSSQIYLDLESEQENLAEVPVKNIFVLADVGTWQGRRNGYKIIENAKDLSKIFSILNGNYDEFKFYIDDKNNLCADLIHHDGKNYLTFFEVSCEDLEKFYESDEEDICAYAFEHFKALGEKVKDFYGISNSSS